MAENQGILYEATINSKLKKYKLQSVSFIPAGSDANAPDAELLFKGKKYKVEVKLDLNVDFGQGSLDYDVENKTWKLGGAKTSSGEQMRSFLTSLRVPELVNKAWGSKGAPRKFTVESKNFTNKDVEFDYANFKDQFIDIPGDSVSRYYNSKSTHYIQIGGYGLYYMGSDPARLSVPSFNMKLRLRIRIKRSGSYPIYNYRFTTAMQAVKGSLHKSTKNLDDTNYLKQLQMESNK